MRHIKYIIINDSMPEASRGKSSNIRIDNLGYHYVINSQGEMLNPIDICNSGAFMSKTAYGQEDLNKCSIGIKFNSSLEPGARPSCVPLVASDQRSSGRFAPQRTLTFELRAKLIRLLFELRSRYPEAAIFALNEIRPETRHLKHETRGIIRVRKDMNQLRRELSDMI